VTTQLTIDVGSDGQTTGLVYASRDVPAHATFILAHGAGAGQQSAFITGFAQGLSDRGVDVLTFNFLYTQQRRRVPDRTEKLEACYRAAVAAARRQFDRSGVFIGGKSMGGRIATHLAAADDADALGIRGVVALGYPLHPPGKPQQLRAAHLSRIRVPMLIVQGERDPFGTPAELRPELDAISAEVTLHVVDNGDHSLAPSRQKDRVASTYAEIQDVIAKWIAEISRSDRSGRSDRSDRSKRSDRSF
jgi:predicted alpha/beta-hydrolase family hydrolase